MMQELSERCLEQLHKKYGKNPPEWMRKRLNEEWILISASEGAEQYLLAAKLARDAKAAGWGHWVAGTTGSSFAAFLLEITECNPLPPHYHCPSCHHVLLAEQEVDAGLDLSDMRCPICGKPMEKDGFDLPYESFLGCSGQEREPRFHIRFPQYYLEQVQFPEIIHEAVQVYGFYNVACLYEMERQSGVPLKSIPLNDPAVFEALQTGTIRGLNGDLLVEIMQTIKPTTFSELVIAFGLSHGNGTWESNAEMLLQQKTADLRQVISHREDIFQMLTRRGVTTADACWYMKAVQRGHFWPYIPIGIRQQLAELGVPDWYLDSMEKIEYLFPKAHTISYLLVAYRLAWFQTHYPHEYAALMKKAGETEGST